ncbi:MAG: prepilin-type N-terminal cleavage/methylation domain-containing protein [Sulfurovum sp.]|nr:prepilin-type N-terminal cleavage/methylation domain-containing protein [Sulfurovum sp.]
MVYCKANRKAFTLLEVLISIALLGIILVPLFSVVDLMKDSNSHLLKSLEKSKEITKATKILFLDILSSDGKIEIKKDEFTRLCLEETKNSIYNLTLAKVCWVVLKDKNTLVRIEGSKYKLPVEGEDKVEVDTIMSDMILFDVYHEKDKVLILLQQKGKKPISFMLQGITNPVLKVLPDGTKIMRDGRKILPDGTEIFKDGSKILPNGTIVPAPNKPKGNNQNPNNQPPMNTPGTNPNQTQPPGNLPHGQPTRPNTPPGNVPQGQPIRPNGGNPALQNQPRP